MSYPSFVSTVLLPPVRIANDENMHENRVT